LYYADEIRIGLRTSHKRRWTPVNLRPSWTTKIPPYSPELNPVERFFQEIRKVLANNIFNDIEEVVNFVKLELEKWKNAIEGLIKLTAYPCIRGYY